MKEWGAISSYSHSPVLWLTVLVEINPTTVQSTVTSREVTPKPSVTVYFPPEEVISRANEVTLVCLVTSTQLHTNYQIFWSESKNQEYIPKENVCTSMKENGTSFVITCLHKIAKEKWDKNTMFECNFKSGATSASGQASKAQGNSLECLSWRLNACLGVYVWPLVQTFCLFCVCLLQQSCAKPSASSVYRVSVVLRLNVPLLQCLTVSC